jgi:hypothetical protein
MGEDACCMLCGGDLRHRFTTLVRGRQRSTFDCSDCGAEITAEALMEP